MNYQESHVKNEQGQSIVLLAFMLVVLLAFAGIAVDVGFAFVRSSQFSAAVDSAALAGVVDLNPTSNDTEEADQRAAQFLAANGWPIDTLSVYPFPSERSLTRTGIPQYSITVTWPVETYFMGLLGFDSFPVTHSATAAFYAQADLLTTTAYNHGHIRTASQFVIGPQGCTEQGDPVSPTKSTPGLPNPEYHLYNGTHHYNIQVTSAYTQSQILRVELFDADSHNLQTSNSDPNAVHSLSFSGGGTPDPMTASCGSAQPGQQCVINTGESLTAVVQNPFWLWRVNEAWDSNCQPQPGTANVNVVTAYELYYLDTAGTRQTIGQYTADNSQVSNTSLQWASPGADGVVLANSGGFEVDLSTIPADDRGNRSILLEVRALSGSGKNVWDIWAGPPPSYYAERGFDPPERNANLRNLQFANEPAKYLNSARGVSVFALGFMPVQHYVSGSKISFPLAPINSRHGGGNIYATLFDFDTAAPPFNSSDLAFFTIDTVSETDFRMHVVVVEDVDSDNCDPGQPQPCGRPGNPLQTSCDGGLNCNNLWMNPQFGMGIPDTFFFGGTLFIDYVPDGNAHTWAVSISAGTPFLTR
jgi:hypothetical protein